MLGLSDGMRGLVENRTVFYCKIRDRKERCKELSVDGKQQVKSRTTDGAEGEEDEESQRGCVM